jgi:hypothetical protein
MFATASASGVGGGVSSRMLRANASAKLHQIFPGMR